MYLSLSNIEAEIAQRETRNAALRERLSRATDEAEISYLKSFIRLNEAQIAFMSHLVKAASPEEKEKKPFE